MSDLPPGFGEQPSQPPLPPPNSPPPQGFPAGYQPPGNQYQQPRTSGKAIGALVTALVGPVIGIFCYCLPLPIAGIIAVVLGRTAKSDIRRSGGLETGEGLATAGEVIGWIEIGLVVLLVPMVIIMLILIGNQTKNVFSNISAGLGT